MSGTALDHPLVRAYLMQLDAALRDLPPGQAGELREQITAHLADALPPDAADEQVTAILVRLGSPADLAADARPGAASSPSEPATIPGIVRARLARVPGLAWALAATLLILIGGGVAYWVSLTPSLQFAGQSAWWGDEGPAVDTTAGNTTQTMVPIRSDQQQGFVVGIVNPTDFTETIVGPAVGPTIEWNSPGSQTVHLGVSVWNRNIDGGGFITDVRFTLPGAIPPHQIRLLRVLWISHVCMAKGGSTSIDQLSLRVRVGWLTRVDVIPLDQAWALSGPSHGPCG